ncbi:hypothetical protein GH811_00780 [Acetobacterium malicum]|uniref:EfeO-type cupredoxin-like domain-containing protein n=1 Tax=Acetobacterium malicum TaxID=52692 RepID=A0ABR6YSI7_9FIRM|nr:hypothetical protein [Acetobacterium malicum]MBC3898148.1 hypothetical protein [Acetobacterium malicum]
MKKTYYLLGTVLAIILLGAVLFSGCTRSSGSTGGSAINSNSSQSQSSSADQTVTAQPSTSSSAAKAIVNDGIQIVSTTLDRGIYDPIIVQTGIPVKWTITANDGDLNSCNNKMLIRSYGVEQKLLVGENVVEFTPTKAGTINYSCWMGMVGSTITVVDDINQ